MFPTHLWRSFGIFGLFASILFFVGADTTWAVTDDIGATILMQEERKEVEEKTSDDSGTDDEQKKDKPKDDEQKKDEPKDDEKKKDKPKDDEQKKDEPKDDEQKKDKPKDEEQKKDEPKGEEQKKDKPKDDEKKEPAKKAEPKKPETIELKREPLRLTLKLTGSFEPKDPKVVRLKAKEFTTFELKEVLPHGKPVRKGDVLARFDEKKYEEAFSERKRALRLSEIDLRSEEIGFATLQAETPLSQEAFELAKKQNDEDFAYYFNVEAPFEKSMNELSLEVSEFQLEYAREELRQLEQMYRQDDLTEETEEIILKRAKFTVKIQEFYQRMSKMYYERSVGMDAPRREERLRRSARMEEIEYRHRRQTFDFSLEQAKLRLERAKQTHQKTVESFEKFKKDKEFLVLRAPADGILYYGEYDKGKWNGGNQIAGALIIGETVRNDQALFSIVEPRPSLFRSTVTEKDLDAVRPGTSGRVTPTAFPDVRYDIKVAEINAYPGPANDYTAMLRPTLPKENKIAPGMTGSVELVVCDKKETLLVPTSTLEKKEEEEDSYNHAYVYLYRETGTTERVKVTLGKVKGDKTEILAGVRVGQEILKSPPKEEKAKAEKNGDSKTVTDAKSNDSKSKDSDANDSKGKDSKTNDSKGKDAKESKE